jgi:hypothetical protein
MMRYAWILDMEQGSEEDFLALWTADAVIESPRNGRYEGIDGIREMFKRHNAGPNSGAGAFQFRHVLTNFLVEGDRDHATMRLFGTGFATPRTVGSGARKDRPPTQCATYIGHYVCDVRKVEGTWKLASRILYLDNVTDTPFDVGSIPWRELPPGHCADWPELWYMDPKYASLLTGRKPHKAAG